MFAKKTYLLLPSDVPQRLVRIKESCKSSPLLPGGERTLMKTPRGKGKRDTPPPPGGRALQRLHQFEQERGLEETDIEHPQPPEPPEEKKKGRPKKCP
jgi:hypothetical protein